MLTIGEAAARAGVSPRTLRYYEQRGLLPLRPRSVGGARRYVESDVSRVARIRQLQDLLGEDLDRISDVLAAEDRLGDQATEGLVLARDIEINNELRAEVSSRRAALDAFAEELEGRTRVYERAARSLRTSAGARA
jgi:DNA-binding transcriptional MerR regulator